MLEDYRQSRDRMTYLAQKISTMVEGRGGSEWDCQPPQIICIAPQDGLTDFAVSTIKHGSRARDQATQSFALKLRSDKIPLQNKIEMLTNSFQIMEEKQQI